MDPLITELITASKTAENDILPSIVEALAAVARTAGKNIGPTVKANLVEMIDEAFDLKTPGMSRFWELQLCALAHFPILDAFSNAIGKLIAGLSLWDPEGVRPILT